MGNKKCDDCKDEKPDVHLVGSVPLCNDCEREFAEKLRNSIDKYG